MELRLAATDETRFSLSDDCRWAAEQTADEDPVRIRIHDLESATERLTLHVHSARTSYYYFLHFSKQGDRLVGLRRGSGNCPATATVWNLVDGRQERIFNLDQGSVRSTLSADGTRLAVEYDRDDIVQVWDTNTGDLVCTAGKQDHVWCLAFSPDGRILASAGEGTANKKRAGEIRIWDPTNGHELARIYNESSWGVTAMAFSPDGQTLASGNGNGTVLFWKVPEHLVAGSK
jgi:WD40 repeat protein